MEKYLVLRDGRESGPYSLEELKSLTLKPFDLIWIIDKSVTWNYPDEIAGLKSIGSQFPGTNNDWNDSALDTVVTENQKKNKTYSALTGVTFALLLIAGVLAAAVFITRDWLRKSEQKVVMQKPVSNKGDLIIPEDAAASISNDFRNAITKELVAAEDSVKTDQHISPKNLKKLVSVESNDYKVGVLGGINKLKLTINNNSDVFLDEVTIQIDYQKKNGSIVHKEIVSEQNIKPQSSKIIDIAPSKRGVKVSYKVIAVESEDNKKVALREA